MNANTVMDTNSDVDNGIRKINWKINPPFVYDGKKDTLILKTWITTCNRYMMLTGVPDDQKILFASTYLKDYALIWFNTLPDEVITGSWHNFTNILIQFFQSPTHTKSIIEKWENLKQRTSVEEYMKEFHEVSAIMPDEYRQEMIMLNKFIKGLKYKTQIEVETRCPSNLDEAMNQAYTFDQIFSRKMGNQARPQIRSSFNGFNSRINNNKFNTKTQYKTSGMQPMEVDNIQNKNRFNNKSKNSKNNSCFNCGEKGHFASSCLKPKRQ